jgi:hypothetical protein
MTHVTLGPSTCHSAVPSYLAKVVGEVTETLRVRDFRRLKDLGCSIRERPKGPKIVSTWKVYMTLGARDFGMSRA